MKRELPGPCRTEFSNVILDFFVKIQVLMKSVKLLNKLRLSDRSLVLKIVKTRGLKYV